MTRRLENRIAYGTSGPYLGTKASC